MATRKPNRIILNRRIGWTSSFPSISWCESSGKAGSKYARKCPREGCCEYSFVIASFALQHHREYGVCCLEGLKVSMIPCTRSRSWWTLFPRTGTCKTMMLHHQILNVGCFGPLALAKLTRNWSLGKLERCLRFELLSCSRVDLLYFNSAASPTIRRGRWINRSHQVLAGIPSSLSNQKRTG